MLGGSISRLLSVAVLIVVIVAIGILFYRVMVGFFVPLFLAALLVVIFRPLHEWFKRQLGNRARLSALLTTATILLIVLIPAALILTIGAAQGTRLLSGVNSQNLTLALGRAREAFGLSIRSPQLHRQLEASINQLAVRTDAETTHAQIAQTRRLADQLQEVYADKPNTPDELFERFDALLVRLDEQVEAAITGDAAALTEPPPEQITVVAPPAGEPAATDATTAELDGLVPRGLTSWQQWQGYQQTLAKLEDTSNELRKQLLGGSMQAELAMLANPSDQTIHQGLTRGRMYLQAQLPSVASATTGFLFHIGFGLVVLIIAIYFFLLDGPAMTRTVMRLSPLDDAYEERLLEEFDRTSRAVVLATILSALAQGVLAALGYYVAGLDSVVLLFLATTFMALIPFLGAMAVWLPCVLWLGFVDERWFAALALGLWGALFVSTIDNVIKVFILHGRSQLHPLLALLSVLGGVQVFGPIGLLVGPMIVVFLQTLLEILQQELLKDSAAEPI